MPRARGRAEASSAPPRRGSVKKPAEKKERTARKQKSAAQDILTDLRPEARTFLVLCVVAAALATTDHVFTTDAFRRWFPDVAHPVAPWAWWSGGLLLCWVAVPMLVARRMGFGPTRLGFGLGTMREKWRVYAVLYLLMLLPLIVAAMQESFVLRYPLYRPVSLSGWTWGFLTQFWFVYFLQFVALEFFFRGFMVLTLKPRLGYAAIAVMIVPYVMIHIHKPWLEALAAIVAGTVLGWLTIKTKSIWGGVILHFAVALTMDCMAMARGDLGFPKAW